MEKDRRVDAAAADHQGLVVSAEPHAGELGDRTRYRGTIHSEDRGRAGRTKEQRTQPADADEPEGDHDPAEDPEGPGSGASSPRCELHTEECTEHHRQDRQQVAQATAHDERDDAVGRTRLDRIDGGPVRAQPPELEGDDER